MAAITLLPHQAAAVAKITGSSRPGYILADDMGLGKTITALAIARDGGARTVLVVCPKATISHWLSECARVFTDHVTTLEYLGVGRAAKLTDFMGADETNPPVAGAGSAAAGAGFAAAATGSAAAGAGTASATDGDIRRRLVFTTPHTLLADFSGDDLAAHRVGWDLLIIDESHTLRNPSTKLFQAAVAVQRDRTLLLTGTPFNNKSLDLSTQCVLAGAPTPVSLLQGAPPPSWKKPSVVSHLRMRDIQWSIEPEDLRAYAEAPTDWAVSIAGCDAMARRRWGNLQAVTALGYTPDDIAADPKSRLIEIYVASTGREPSRKDSVRIESDVCEIAAARRLAAAEGARQWPLHAAVLNALFRYRGGDLYAEARVTIAADGQSVESWGAGLERVLRRRGAVRQWNALWSVPDVRGGARPLTIATYEAVRDTTRETFFLRRTKAEIPEIRDRLPPMEVGTEMVPLDETQETLHAALTDEFLKAFTKYKRAREILGVAAGEAISKLLGVLTRWRMSTVSSQLAVMKKIGEGETRTLEDVLRDRSRAGIMGRNLETTTYAGKPLVHVSSKYARVLAECQAAQVEGRKLLVMSGWTTALLPLGELCQAEGINAVQLDGSMSLKVRNAIVEQFQDPAAETNIPVLLCSIKACGVGLTLTRANRILFLEPQYNPFGEELQAMQRIHRIGQEGRTSAIFYTATRGGGKKTIDHYVRALQDGKMDSALGVLGGSYLDASQTARAAGYEHKGKLARLAAFIEE